LIYTKVSNQIIERILNNKAETQTNQQSIAKNIRGTLAFGLLISCIFITAIGFTSWKILNILDNHIEELVEESTVKTDLIYDMKIAAVERNLYLLMMLLRDDSFGVDEEWMKFRNQGSEFLIAREKLKNLGLNDEESRLLNQQRELSIETVQLQYEIYENIMVSDHGNALIKFNQHLDNQVEVFASLDALLGHQKAINSMKVNATRQSESVAIRTIISLSILVIFIMYFITIYIIKRLSLQALFIENEGLKFKALIEGGMDAVLVLDRKKVTDCNQNALKLFVVDSLDELNHLGFDYFSRFSDIKADKDGHGVFNTVNHALL